VRTYILGRVVALVPVLLVVAVVIFSLLRLTPGDPAAVMLGDQATVEAIRDLRRQLGLDEPIPVQLVRWMASALQGNLGKSIFLDKPVTAAIAERIEPTVMLTLYAMLFAILLGVPLGTLAALKQGSVLDRFLMITSLVGISAPSFLIGLLLILYFAVELRWLPSGGYRPIASGLGANLTSLVLPSIALGLSQLALIARMSRTAVLEVLGADYIRTAFAKGLSFEGVVVGHILRNALISIVTIIGLSFGVLMGGTVVIETLFDLPGVGRLVIGSVLRRDYPVIQGAVLYVTCVIVLVNLMVDVLYAWLDPRIRY
jgi:peptide/nickel transport system permease protein